jgi:hypothetical protein
MDSKRLFEDVYFDLVNVTQDGGFTSIVVMMDERSNFCVLVPVMAESGGLLSQIFERYWLSVFGAPQTLHSQDLDLTTPDMKRVLVDWGVKVDIHKTNSAYQKHKTCASMVRITANIKKRILSMNAGQKNSDISLGAQGTADSV